MSLLDRYTIISNSCVGIGIYERLLPNKHPSFIEYNNPFIATLVLHDNEFVDLCSNYEYYMSIEPIFAEPKTTTLRYQQTGKLRYPLYSQYPVMHLDNVEIHWIHDSNKKNILRKFKGRNICGPERIFVWSTAEIYAIQPEQDRKQLIKRFLSLPDRSIFLTDRKEEAFEDQNHLSVFIPEWEGKDHLSRRFDHVVTWQDQGFICETVIKYLDKWL